MIETMAGVTAMGELGYLSIMSFLTIILVEDLKHIVPKKFPTAALTLIVALLIAILLPIMSGVITFASIITSILNGFIVAFVSMNGFDSLKNIWERVTKKGDDKNE